MQNAIEFNAVWKKFRKGEKFNSLRDAIPNFIKSFKPSQYSNAELKESEFWAVKDVSFQIKPGEVVGFIGPNGAGKSTILKLLSRIMSPTQGTLKINGRLSALIEVTAGFHPELTGRENVYLNGTILGMKRSELDSKFDDIVEFSGLREFIDTPVKRYSSGMFSRLGFSVAAHVNPDVLLVDEVLAVGDIAFQSKCAMKMRELMSSGTTIMLVSHNLQLVQSLCKRIILIDKGQVLMDSTPEKAIPAYEEIISKQKEEEFKSKIEKSDYKVKLKEEHLLDIDNLTLIKNGQETTEYFNIEDEIAFNVSYICRKKMDGLVFLIEIIRDDGVLCCSSSSKDANSGVNVIKDNGRVTINFGKNTLNPGVYAVKVSVWDADMLHPYAIRKNDIFRIVSENFKQENEGVFNPQMRWNFK